MMIANYVARVLVADDDLSTRMLLQTALEGAEFFVELAKDGDDAISKFSKDEFDIVLLDVEMPGKNGFDVCVELRKRFGSDFPIVMVTGMNDVGSIEKAFELGATDFIPKPIHWTLVSYRMKYILRSYRNLQALADAGTRNLALLQALPDSLLWFDKQGKLLDVYGSASWLPKGFQRASVAEILSADRTEALHTTLLNTLSDGVVRGFACAIPDMAGNLSSYEGRVSRISNNEGLCLLRDVSRRLEAEKQAQYLAHYNSLTGLMNNTSFQRCIEKEIEHCAQVDEKFAILRMGLDGFREINNLCGSNFGDGLLKWVADLLQANLQPDDFSEQMLSGRRITENGPIVSHYGGSEFSILLPSIAHPGDAMALARKIQKWLKKPHDEYKNNLTASFGISCFPNDAEDAISLMKFSGAAMHDGKVQGRDNCRFYDAALTVRAKNRLDMELGLRQAIEQNEFLVYYQPQVDSRVCSISTVEALVRWNRPGYGLVSPAEFIPLAEDLGLIHKIGEYVLRKACADLVCWDGLGVPPIKVAVNLSPLELHCPDFMGDLKRILQETSLSPERLELEITESALMQDAEGVMDLLRSIRKLGVEISIDDFGTGYSSLSYLKNFPITALKIDRSFVERLPHSKQDEAIIKAVVSLSDSLGVSVVAEGVETKEQAAILTRLGCRFLQGYLYGRPQSFEAITQLLTIPRHRTGTR